MAVSITYIILFTYYIILYYQRRDCGRDITVSSQNEYGKEILQSLIRSVIQCSIAYKFNVALY